MVTKPLLQSTLRLVDLDCFSVFLLSILSQTLVYKNIVRSSWVVLYKDIWHSSLSGMTSCLINIQYIYSVHKSKSDLVADFLYIFVKLI